MLRSLFGLIALTFMFSSYAVYSFDLAYSNADVEMHKSVSPGVDADPKLVFSRELFIASVFEYRFEKQTYTEMKKFRLMTGYDYVIDKSRMIFGYHNSNYLA